MFGYWKEKTKSTHLLLEWGSDDGLRCSKWTARHNFNDYHLIHTWEPTRTSPLPCGHV